MPDPTVYVIDDDDGVRRSLQLLLGFAGYHVRGFDSAEAFLSCVEDATPGPVLLDLRLPGMDGLDCLRVIAGRRLPFPAILLTGFADVPLAVQAMQAGAVTVLEKPWEREALLAALQEAQARLPAPRAATGRHIHARSRLDDLTRRERDVLGLLVAGLANKAIAHDLGISCRTVEVHRARIMDKMGARSFSNLVKIALEAGYGA
ncbi:response regulator transcription factor [Rubellimicrobium aerolatum]|uniref:Response regulator transcription factor n=1 Tax=Rubellimicrobium aerolatum TaxID=490979 RepID=A0ABW0SGE1_9RHOB|nr:response regulator [Rubellimicrobium aerolatum]MBP1807422.1 two-component system response regulator FixJ [Rubellimicrobium aerolatum]